MTEVNRAFQERGLVILAVNIQEHRNQVAPWVKEKGVSVPVLLDLTKGVTTAYQVRGTPTVVLVGRDGHLVGRATGPRSWLSEAGRRLLEGFVRP